MHTCVYIIIERQADVTEVVAPRCPTMNNMNTEGSFSAFYSFRPRTNRISVTSSLTAANIQERRRQVGIGLIILREMRDIRCRSGGCRTVRVLRLLLKLETAH